MVLWGLMRLMPSEAECEMLREVSRGEDITDWTAGDFSPWRMPAPMIWKENRDKIVDREINEIQDLNISETLHLASLNYVLLVHHYFVR